MKKIIGFALLILFLVFLYRKFRVAPSLPFAETKLVNIQGETINFSQITKEKKIVCFYASWCGDCLKELNDLNQVYDSLNGLKVIAITDEGLESAIDFSSRKKYPFTFYSLTRSFSEIDIHSIPVTYILNDRGEVIFEKVGAINWKDASFKKHLEGKFN